MTTSPFIRVNRPEPGGAHAEEALVQDVIDLCYRRDPVKFSRLCLAAERAGTSLREYVARQVRELLDTTIVLVTDAPARARAS